MGNATRMGFTLHMDMDSLTWWSRCKVSPEYITVTHTKEQDENSPCRVGVGDTTRDCVMQWLVLLPQV